MINDTKLLFGIHMHQPIDNFEWVIEKGVETCYGPFFEVMSQYPEFKFAVHCSGWLMEQIKAYHPKLFSQISSLAHKGSIEFFSAGYYEPILSVIPSDNRVKQIDMLNEAIRSDFNQKAQGLWLTERVWESSLIPDLTRAGIQYTVMDDYHFQCAGFDEDILDGYYMSEEGGNEIGLFPINKKLRYAIPFLNVDTAIKTIKAFNRQSDSAAIIFDDAEKFGMWPGTYEWVYEKGWLKRFVEAVLADEQIVTMHYREYYEQKRTRGIAYLPNVSYYEMGEWSLRAEDTLKLQALKKEIGKERYEQEGIKFLKGGIWKNFLVKYEESNRIHKRTLELSKVRQSVNKAAFDTALYKAQTNDALWHGVFGGLYLPNLRDNVYRYIIEAENIRYGRKQCLEIDENEMDGYPKVKMIMPKCIFRFDAANGGQLVEFDIRKKSFNWQNTLTRRKEAYHQSLLDDSFEEPEETLSSQEGIDTIHHTSSHVDDSLRNAIIYDWYLKNSFIDHISDEHFNGDNFRYCNFTEYGDFANQPFEMEVLKKRVSFWRDGGVYLPDKQPTRLEKSYISNQKGFDFRVMLNSDAQRTFQYILEHNLHFADYEQVRINGEALGEEGSLKGLKNLEIHDRHLKQMIVITLDKPFDLYYFRLNTLSQSEEGFDLSAQGVSFAMTMPFSQTLTLNGSLEVIDV